MTMEEMLSAGPTAIFSDTSSPAAANTHRMHAFSHFKNTITCVHACARTDRAEVGLQAAVEVCGKGPQCRDAKHHYENQIRAVTCADESITHRQSIHANIPMPRLALRWRRYTATSVMPSRMTVIIVHAIAAVLGSSQDITLKKYRSHCIPACSSRMAVCQSLSTKVTA